MSPIGKGKQETRQQQRHARRTGAHRRKRPSAGSVAFTGGMILLIVVGVVAIFFFRQTADDPVEPPEGTETIEVESAQHVNGPVPYEHIPPVGGEHAPVWQNCGFYADPVPTEQGVHSLEHGAVWITFDPELSEEQVSAVRGYAGAFVLVSPWPGRDLPSPVVASAWGRQLQVDSPTDPRLAEFIRAFVRGPQTPEPGAACSGGAGQPAA